jgi:DNA-binding IclR family transcriptional regulator
MSFPRCAGLGFAVNDGELELDLRAVAAPIWDGNGRAAAAVTVAGMAASISMDRLTGELARAAQDTAWQISRALGYSGDRAAQNGF